MLGKSFKPEFYSIAEAAQLLSVHPNTIKNWIRNGTLPAGKAGRQWRIAAHDLRALVEPKNRVSGAPKREEKK